MKKQKVAIKDLKAKKNAKGGILNFPSIRSNLDLLPMVPHPPGESGAESGLGHRPEDSKAKLINTGAQPANFSARVTAV